MSSLVRTLELAIGVPANGAKMTKYGTDHVVHTGEERISQRIAKRKIDRVSVVGSLLKFEHPFHSHGQRGKGDVEGICRDSSQVGRHSIVYFTQDSGEVRRH